jgi:hypothetical protein
VKGFTLTEIYEMSIDQVILFCKNAQSLEKAEMQRQVIVATAGARYDEKSLKELHTKLGA